ncbi:hypothetical protein [Halochromatium glycolicum]|uniref:Uncharacterized protein n=1 Tax=Halochromatium glycolicum TaxID=85075 RepID=A0AAJ0U760_9GAMM|nr:hypothetical protein [Halochromatium glycolicum]MBK1706457.1 hypothetical protein [Halochromatium glycolicum]
MTEKDRTDNFSGCERGDINEFEQRFADAIEQMRRFIANRLQTQLIFNTQLDWGYGTDPPQGVENQDIWYKVGLGVELD